MTTEDTPTLPPELRDPPPHVEGHALRVLVADDDRMLRESLVAFFELCGFDARGVNGSDELLADLNGSWLLARDHKPPDVIVTDLDMPGADVVPVIEGVSESSWRLPVIVVSGTLNDVTIERLKRVEDVTVLRKPVDPSMLYEQVIQATGVRWAPSLDGSRAAAL